MKNLKAELTRGLETIRHFDRDEDGIESIQVVMILAFAAVVMVAAWASWDSIKTWADGLMNTLKAKQ